MKFCNDYNSTFIGNHTSLSVIQSSIVLHKDVAKGHARYFLTYYGDVIMSAMTSQITSLTIVCSNVYSGADQRKHQSSASWGFVRGIHRWPVNSPHKGPVTRKRFPFDDVIMILRLEQNGKFRKYFRVYLFEMKCSCFDLTCYGFCSGPPNWQYTGIDLFNG